MIKIIEGPDFAGKTTLAKQLFNEDTANNINAIYVHFPIRNIKDDIIANFYIINNKPFIQCDDLNNKSMDEIQDIILNNLIDNASTIIDLHNSGVNVYIDRYIMSNIVYRLVHNISLPVIDNTDCDNLIEIAETVLLLPNVDLLLERCNTDRGKKNDLLDKINETEDKIILASYYYNKLSENSDM